MLSIFSFPVKAQSDSAREAFGKQILLALKSNDFELYKKLYTNLDEYIQLIQAVAKTDTGNLHSDLLKMLPENYKLNGEKNCKAEFLKLRKQADSLGIDWKNAIFAGFESIAAFPENIPYKFLTGDVRFTVLKSCYLIEEVTAFEFKSPFLKIQKIKGVVKYE